MFNQLVIRLLLGCYFLRIRLSLEKVQGVESGAQDYPPSSCSYQLSSRYHLHFASDVDGRLVVFLFRLQIQERGAADLVSLFDLHVYGVGSEVTVFDEVAGETAVGAACGGVFGDTVARGEHAGREVRSLVRLGAEDQDIPGLDVLYKLEVAVVVHPAALQGVEAPERDDKGRKSGGYFLYGIVVVQAGSFEV
jgi:hypothetical protein